LLFGIFGMSPSFQLFFFFLFLFLRFAHRHQVMSKFELQRVCRATGATAIIRVGPPTAEETGFCDIVSVEEIGGWRVTVFRQDAEERCA
jgi:hypothetical protein